MDKGTHHTTTTAESGGTGNGKMISDEVSSSRDETTTASGGGANDGGEGDDHAELVKKHAITETRRVRLCRYSTLLAIVISGVVIAIATYATLENAEKHELDLSFAFYAEKIRDYTLSRARGFVKAIDWGVDTVTSDAIALNQTWPFVTVPMFEHKGAHARSLSESDMIAYAPLVSESQRAEWERYAVSHQDWVEEGQELVYGRDYSYPISGHITELVPVEGGDENGNGVNISTALLERAKGPGPYMPVFQMTPTPFDPSVVNIDLLSDVTLRHAVQSSVLLQNGIITDLRPTGVFAEYIRLDKDRTVPVEETGYPHSAFLHPIFNQLHPYSTEVVGVLVVALAWGNFLHDLIPDNARGIYAVLNNTCGQAFTYTIDQNGQKTGVYGDSHPTNYDHTEVIIPLSNILGGVAEDVAGHCRYNIFLYSSDDFSTETGTQDIAVIVTAVIACLFALMALLFLSYDRYVRRRDTKIVSVAAKANQIVSSLFPSNVRERLYEEGTAQQGTTTKLRTFLNDGSSGNDDAKEEKRKTKPIADLFPETTILFADIVGFTAWSSVREPCQVFELLETLYERFDDIAAKRRIFKVETVGDCYVAVAGLPDPRRDHAVAMCRFARDILYSFSTLTKSMEVTLGPDTGELGLRIGLHSGPVTAGVLRGERARFQLFGDTMNTAARMESNGLKNKIHLSQDTVDLLALAGKDSWTTPREDKINAKGKGLLQTFWLVVGKTNSSSNGDSTDVSTSNGLREWETDISTEVAVNKLGCGNLRRFIDWNHDVLSRLLKQVVARREARILRSDADKKRSACDILFEKKQSGETVLDEVCEIITLPPFNAEEARIQQDPENIDLGSEVENQLREFVSNIAALYHDNPFHNFEHASHVTMSVVKLLSRIVAPSELELDLQNGNRDSSTLHDHTYGITSDPLTQFACVLSALIHDVDHPGIPNSQLIKENSQLAAAYKNKSIAEQNSVDLAWHLLMDDSLAELRAAIYSDESEMRRFRQLVVNSVMATDIMDKDLSMARKARWNKAFSESAAEDEDVGTTTNRKATIVIEHLIQASDVAHTMQHWHIYRKWNGRLFEELFKAYKEGRADSDPSENWYRGEIGFFDFYIIPLAKKLKDCGVFGVMSDEYLNYALKNRSEWEARGMEVVAEMVDRANKAWLEKGSDAANGIASGGLPPESDGSGA